jgi:hypothetical protein
VPEIWNGKQVALEDDLCVCACPQPPKLKPNQHERYQELGEGESSSKGTSDSAAVAPDDAELSPFDEQIAFVLEQHTPIAHTLYRLTLADGTTTDGTTDAYGRTARIVTKEPLRIVRADLIVPASQNACCGSAAGSEQYVAMSFQLTVTATNSQNVGGSLVKVSVGPTARPLTAGEIHMARQLFRESIDYAKVRVHNRGFFWLNLQSRNTAVTPNGEIYFNEEDFSEDFSKGLPEQMHWFMHEMVHVWQHQLGYPVMLRGAFRAGLNYEYSLRPGTTLSDYDMEAQGNILADYFVLRILNKPDSMVRRQYRYSLKLYDEVLRDFFLDRSDIKNLPGSTPGAPGRSDYDN